MFKFKALILSVIITALGYTLWVLSSDWVAVGDAMVSLGWGDFLIVCLLSVANYLLRFVRWQYLLKCMGHKLPITPHLLTYLSGFSLTTTPGKAGEAIRSFYLKPYGVPYSQSLAALVAERLTDLFAIAIIALGAIVIWEPYRKGFVLLFALLLGGLWLLQYRPFTDWALINIEKIKVNAIQRIGKSLLKLLSDLRVLIGLKPLWLGLFVGLLAWGAEAFAFAWMIDQLGYQHPYLLLASIYALSTLAGALSFLPGGLGSTEIVMALLLTTLSFTQADTVTITLLCRIATLWLAVLIGFIALAVLQSSLFKSPVGNQIRHE